MAVMEISPARQVAPQPDGAAVVAGGVVECIRAVAQAVAEAHLAAAELALDAAELAARARELRLEQQQRRAAMTGVAIQVVAMLRAS